MSTESWRRLVVIAAVALFSVAAFTLPSSPAAAQTGGITGPPGTPGPTPVPGPWTEPWASTSAWSPITQSCSTVSAGVLTMKCQSAALETKRTWDPTQPITLSGNVSGQAATGSSTTDYWAGLVLNQDADVYAELATNFNVPPFRYHGPIVGSLTEPIAKPLVAATPGQFYTLKIVWNPTARQVVYSINGTVYQTIAYNFTRPLKLWTICVAVGEGVPNNGTQAECHFGPVTVS